MRMSLLEDEMQTNHYIYLSIYIYTHTGETGKTQSTENWTNTLLSRKGFMQVNHLMQCTFQRKLLYVLLSLSNIRTLQP